MDRLPCLHLERQLELQELGVAGSSVAVQLGVFGVPFDGFRVVLHGLGVVPFLKTLIAFVLLLQGQVRVYVGQPLLLLQDFLCLLAFLEHIWGSVLCQRLVIEMDGILVLFFFEVRVANSCISSDKDTKKNLLRAEHRQGQPLQRQNI